MVVTAQTGKQSTRAERMQKFADGAVAACHTLLGGKVTGREAPGGNRQSIRVSFADGSSVIVTRRNNLQRARLEATAMYALFNHGANVPKVIAFDGIWLIQEDMGDRRLAQALNESDRKEGLAWVEAAVTSLAQVHRAGWEASLERNVIPIGQKPHWIPQIVDMPKRLGRLLKLAPPKYPETRLVDAMRMRRPYFIKWDARPGNAMARPDGTVGWFDWEHSGCRNRPDDLVWLLADEYTPDWGDADVKIFKKHLKSFVGQDETPDEVLDYMAIYMTLHSCVRLALIFTSKKDGPWWNTDSIIAGDKVGVAEHMCRRNVARAARWALLSPLTQGLAPWFADLTDKIPPPDEKKKG